MGSSFGALGIDKHIIDPFLLHLLKMVPTLPTDDFFYCPGVENLLRHTEPELGCAGLDLFLPIIGYSQFNHKNSVDCGALQLIATFYFFRDHIIFPPIYKISSPSFGN